MTERLSTSPVFSIVIPVYGRAGLLQRAVSSCLQQSYDSFEVIVVDDGSPQPVSAVQHLADSRVRIVRQPSNRGPGPARNLGADHARGEWVVCLDSDDELLPNALDAMAAAITMAPSHASGFRFMCRLDDGTLSPQPPLQTEVWDYRAYMRWAESVLHGRQETLPCVRRNTFETVRYPDRHGNIEALYHLDFARAFLIASSPAVVRAYHSGAPGQLTRPQFQRTLDLAAGYTEYFQELLDRHGAAMRQHAPGLFAHFTRALATQRFLNADRIGGMRSLAQLTRVAGFKAASFAVLALGLAGPRPLAWARSSRIRTVISAGN